MMPSTENEIETPTLISTLDDTPPSAGDLYEIVNGQVVEPPPMSAFESVFANTLAQAIQYHFARAGESGRCVVEVLFRLQSDPNLQRRPDLALISYERWAKSRPVPWESAWRVVPDLAVEVVSPNDLAFEVLEKLDDYFRAGVRQVWVVYPRHGRVFIYTGPKSVIGLDVSGTLDGGEILPGFQLRLAELFGGTTGTPGQTE